MPSFDIVSKVQWNEVDNAFNQAQKELSQRFDFKDTDTSRRADARRLHHPLVERGARQGRPVLQDKLVKRKVSLST